MRLGRIVAPFILLNLPFCQQAQQHSFKDPASVRECSSLQIVQDVTQAVTEQGKCFGRIICAVDLNGVGHDESEPTHGKSFGDSDLYLVQHMYLGCIGFECISLLIKHNGACQCRKIINAGVMC